MTPLADEKGTSGWSKSRAQLEEAFVPGTQLFSEFVELTNGLGRKTFYSEYQTPHVLISGSVTPEGDGQIRTDAASRSDLKAEAAKVRIAAVDKHSDRNAFMMMITVGRTDNNDLTLKHSMISKFHAYFREVDGQWSIADAGSLNGTVLDGRRLPSKESVPIHSGSRIVLGGAVVLEFLEARDLYDAVQMA